MSWVNIGRLFQTEEIAGTLRQRFAFGRAVWLEQCLSWTAEEDKHQDALGQGGGGEGWSK